MSVYVTGTAQVQANLAKYLERQLATLRIAAGAITDLLRNYCRANHPWKNRTGDTEASIDSQIVEEAADKIVIAVAAGMDYDVFVELAHGGQWAWLWPAIEANRKPIMDILASFGVVAGLSGGMSTTQAVTGPMQDVMAGNTF